MRSKPLKKAMKWDEDTYGLEVDLDQYNVVAVGDFNAGAMENKGLNVFNTKLVLARPDISTDFDFSFIDRTVAHEYFHNWTGNRVTCRDWFQLSLKEGLTVFREAAVRRRHVFANRWRAFRRCVRCAPRSFRKTPARWRIRCGHRPTSRSATSTPQPSTSKGAEVVRMMHTLVGA